MLKLKFFSLMHRWPLLILAILCMPFDFIALKSLNYLAFQSFDIDRTWWWLFQKRVVRTKFDIYVFIKQKQTNKQKNKTKQNLILTTTNGTYQWSFNILKFKNNSWTQLWSRYIYMWRGVTCDEVNN
jgi:hypothetical protein